jgi:hypothetical protein
LRERAYLQAVLIAACSGHAVTGYIGGKPSWLLAPASHPRIGKWNSSSHKTLTRKTALGGTRHVSKRTRRRYGFGTASQTKLLINATFQAEAIVGTAEAVVLLKQVLVDPAFGCRLAFRIGVTAGFVIFFIAAIVICRTTIGI